MKQQEFAKLVGDQDAKIIRAKEHMLCSDVFFWVSIVLSASLVVVVIAMCADYISLLEYGILFGIIMACETWTRHRSMWHLEQATELNRDVRAVLMEWMDFS